MDPLPTIPLSRPEVSSDDIEAVVEVLRTPRLSLGPRAVEFERALAAWVGSRAAVAVSSGSAGLQLALAAIGVGEGDEVVTTPFSFIASSNVILKARARPVFVDIEPGTLGPDPDRLETALTSRTRALLPVHIFGRLCRIGAILEIASRHRLRVVEDACEALGTTLGGRHAGTFGAAGVYGFYPNKTITTGEGGMIVTNDDALDALLRSLRNQGRDGGGDGWTEHSRLGESCRMTEMQAALGLSQTRRGDELVRARARVAAAYRERLSGVDGLVLPSADAPGERTAWALFVVRLEKRFARDDRDAVLGRLRACGIECRAYFPPIHLQPFYRELFGFREGDFPVAESAAARTIALPFFGGLGDAEIDRVCETLASAVAHLDRRAR